MLTFPFPLRFLFANDPHGLSEVLAVVQRAISSFVIRHSGLTVSSGARLQPRPPAGGLRGLPHRHRPARRAQGPHPYSVAPLDGVPNSPLLARLVGFSLHAATVCEAYQRGRLERLYRYITRPPVATKRLSVARRCCP